jgi:spore germination protein GerM
MRYLSLFNLLGVAVLVGAIYLFSKSDILQVTQAINLPADLEKYQGPKTFNLYFANEKGDNFVQETRTINLTLEDYPYNAATSELLKGPQQPGGFALLPVGTAAPTVYVREGTAYVDLPEAYSKLNLGISGETMLIFGMVNTLLGSFSELKQVKFLIKGKDVISLGHLALLEPFVRQ